MIRTRLMGRMMKCANVLEIISPVTGSLCVPDVGCLEAIVLVARGGETAGYLELGGDLIKADNGPRKDVLYCIHLQPPLL